MIKDQSPISKEKATAAKGDYDLEERTAKFGEAVLAFAKRIPVTPVNSPIISQLVRAAISVGANYCEADEADTKKEFRYSHRTL